MMSPENDEYDSRVTVSCNLQLWVGALPCDAYHHYYHYQSSAQYLWLARIYFALGAAEEARAALEKSLFQDHFNQEALHLKRRAGHEEIVPHYDRHPLFDADFCASINRTADEATDLHDDAVKDWLEENYEVALARFQAAAASSPQHSNSYLGVGKCLLMLKQPEQALGALKEAIRLSHLQHDAYHRMASTAHVERGREFLAQGKLDLAINDFTKALDLFRGNQEAFDVRAQAYRLRQTG